MFSRFRLFVHWLLEIIWSLEFGYWDLSNRGIRWVGATLVAHRNIIELMAQPPHFDIEGAIYFVTTRLKDKRRPLSDYEAEVIKRTILELSDREEIMLYAFVVMPDHIHILLRSISNGLSKTMQLIKGRSSRQIGRLKPPLPDVNLPTDRPLLPDVNLPTGRGDFSRPINNLWQKGFFDFVILTEEKFKEKFNYIHYNPVKRGLVERAEDYKYSSAIEYKVKYGEVFYE